jgi:hypothetical protein|uniref:Spherulation-specific family 4 n=1 Tax=Bionectria ochroleuca TaxID=29856 RepID=A0A8H7NJP0_BIOOC
MRFLASTATLASVTSMASATGLLLPLYVYPSAEWQDGAANWNPVFTAVGAYPDLKWTIVVNPENGPGSTGEAGNGDVNYITGISKLNAYDNVNTVGYVRTNYAATSLETVKSDVTTFAGWTSYTDSDVSVHGIFFDEVAADFDYMNEVITHTRSAFKGETITTICNFGVAASEEFYTICDIVVAFESCLNCSTAPQYKSQTTIDANIPKDYASQASIILNNFSGAAYDGSTANAALIDSYVSTIASNGVGWFYFTSADYNDITTAPATVGQNADSLAKAIL